ncbi:hypothetical protein [Thiomicrorhabdus sediminis]|uniref:Uncharacterized protein n=1 Tax=Thiomicrorhabdus sediminis TaxID=2580412 RepID=A0A4P9K3S4_9GAMM|nr:hypothetical protein [Thiomicrorhabdus sediminis]QCU89552.1 hypothetical protein FE785_02320 [Thiomicrorhabdus sediminis]
MFHSRHKKAANQGGLSLNPTITLSYGADVTVVVVSLLAETATAVAATIAAVAAATVAEIPPTAAPVAAATEPAAPAPAPAAPAPAAPAPPVPPALPETTPAAGPALTTPENIIATKATANNLESDFIAIPLDLNQKKTSLLPLFIKNSTM